MRNLTILQINDLHGYLAPHPELFDLTREHDFRSGGGLARIATIFESARRETNGAVIAFDNGDAFHGTMPAVKTRGEALIAPIALLGLDAMTAHWEFAYGLQRVREISARLPYPLLAANILAAGGSPFCSPFTVVERAGLRVGVIGLAAVVATKLLPPEERNVLRITVGDAELPPCIRSLRREHAVDLVLVLSHLGFPHDCKLAASVAGIDVILSGHTHNRLTSPLAVGDTLIMQSGAHGSFVGRLDLSVSADGIAGWSHRLQAVDDSCEPDAEMSVEIRRVLEPFVAASSRVVAETECGLHRYAMFESTMDNLLLDATASAAGTTVALSNGWRYGAPIPPGPLTECDLWNIVPANPLVSVVELSGREIRWLFEDNLEATFACDAWEQRGGYVKRCRGLELVVKIENPAGSRVQEMSLDGRRLTDGTHVSVGFLGGQAVPEGVGRNRRSTGVAAVEALERYVRAHQSVAPRLRGHVRAA